MYRKQNVLQCKRVREEWMQIWESFAGCISQKSPQYEKDRAN